MIFYLEFLPVKKNVIVIKIENEVLASISLQGFVEIFTSQPKNVSIRNLEKKITKFEKDFETNLMPTVKTPQNFSRRLPQTFSQPQKSLVLNFLFFAFSDSGLIFIFTLIQSTWLSDFTKPS